MTATRRYLPLVVALVALAAPVAIGAEAPATVSVPLVFLLVVAIAAAAGQTVVDRRRLSQGIASRTAVIRWRAADDRGRFYAAARPIGGGDEVVVAQSPLIEWPPRNRNSVLAMTQAVEDLEWTLVAAGWQADGVGKHWYERRFTRMASVHAPELVEHEPPVGPAHGTAALLDARHWLPAPEPPEVLLTNARVRLVLAAVSLGSLSLGTIAAVAGVSGVRAVCLIAFCLIGIGSAPWQGNVELRLAARLTLTLLTSFAVLTFVSMAMLGARSWHPLLAFAVVALACVPFHVVGLRSALTDVRLLRVAGWPAVRVRPATLALVGAGAALCLVTAATHRHLDPGFYGFLTQIGPAWYVGVALLLVALVTARADEEQEMALPVLVLALVLTLTPALVYDGPRSQSAGKHVDLVMQIQTYHALISSLDIYNNWSGFFASVAWLCDVAAIRDPMSLATFWPPLIVGFRVAALRFLFGQLLNSRRQCWIAVALAVLADSLGLDYFSPQSVGFLLGLVVFGLALSSYPSSTRLTLVLIAGCVLAMSHQLSPYVVGGVLVVLVVFKQVRPWWTPALVLGPAVLWALAHAKALEGFLSLDAIGRPQNFHPPETPSAGALERLPVVRETVFALLFSIAVLGVLALVGLLKHKRQRRYWAWAVCPGAGLALVAINAYGQEGVFRAVLFGLPWLAALAASWLAAPPRLMTRIGALALVAALTTAHLIASFGLDAMNVVRPADVAAYRYFRSDSGVRPAATHYVLPLGSGDLPRVLPLRRGGWDTLNRAKINTRAGKFANVAPVLEMRLITAKLLRYSGEPVRSAELYTVWSPVQSLHDWAYAVRTPARSAALRDAFVHSPYWRVVFHRDGTVLLKFDPGRYAAAG
jgi:hypothetical protein